MTLPLAGIKVIDFSEHGFVPSAAAALGDWGADVVKIERPDGDPMRQIIKNGLVADADGYDYLFQLVNRNKRGVSIDVLNPAGREVFERLVKWADVYITNQLPRVRRKLRTEPSDLFAINERLVFAKGHGQGQRGPGAEQGGFDAVSFWSRGGLAHTLSDPASGQLVGARPALGDVPTGMFLAGGVCAALVHVLRTGKGVVVDTSLLNGANWTLSPDLAYASLVGAEAPRRTSAPGDRSPLGWTYTTSDRRWLMLMMLDEGRYWAQTCRALGVEDLIDRFPDDDGRRAAWGLICERFTAAIGGFTRDELARRLTAEDCIYSFVASPPEVVEDPAVVENGYLMAHPTHAPLRLAAAPAQFDDELPSVRRTGPDLGADTREVLAEIGYSATEVTSLVEAGAVVTAD
ncbi:MAG TPA: CoA transferase [Acidimicrobiales bacterium]|nr:CoA transferase [Acidimicrobiales bacterium]